LAKLAENIRASPFKEELSMVYHFQPNSSSWTIHKMFFFQTLYKQAPILRFSFATIGKIIKNGKEKYRWPTAAKYYKRIDWKRIFIFSAVYNRIQVLGN
jgi:hypothetical protein